MNGYAFILYGNYQNPYFRLVRVTDGLVFDISADQLSQAPNWQDTATSLGGKDVVVNGWPVSLPENLPNGVYDFQLYDAETASESDDMVAGWRLIMPYKLLVEPTAFPLDIFGRIRILSA